MKAVGSAIDSGNWNVLLMLFPLAILFLFLGWKLIVRLFVGRKRTALLKRGRHPGEGSRNARARKEQWWRAGATRIWYSGPDDPVPMLHEVIGRGAPSFRNPAQ